MFKMVLLSNLSKCLQGTLLVHSTGKINAGTTCRIVELGLAFAGATDTGGLTLSDADAFNYNSRRQPCNNIFSLCDYVHRQLFDLPVVGFPFSLPRVFGKPVLPRGTEANVDPRYPIQGGSRSLLPSRYRSRGRHRHEGLRSGAWMKRIGRLECD